MSYLEAVEGLDTLPRRIFLEGEREPIPDPDGFILPIGTVLTPKGLLEQAAVLAVAPPWTGKTTVAKRVADALKAYPFLELTCFEERERGARVEPSWWERWKASEDEAVWIVDGLDEDARKDRQSFKILQLLRGAEGARARLHLIALCRTNEIPDWFERGLEELCGTWSTDQPLGLRRLRLAGLDRETARDHVGPSRFDRVCQLIRSNDLQALAPYPAALSYLAEREESENLTKGGVWEGVLRDLLREKRDDPLHPSLESEVEDRFSVAQRLAALTTFCGVGAVRPEAGLESLFPANLPGSAELRLAAREAWRMSIFERSDRGYRFSQDHVRQWLTAFALRDMTLLQLRPLLSQENGELEPAHEGVVGLLAQISSHQKVRDWLVTAHGGLPGGSDAAWSLPDTARALDRLQEIARTSPWGLSLWREERLRSFGNVPGIGVEIARRLEGDLHPAEQQLLLELALVIDAQEAVVPAARILQDGRGDERARERAASLVAALGTAEHLAPLVAWVEAMQEDPGKAVLSTLEVAFYENGLWSFEKAAERAFSGSALRSDWLQYRLADELTLDRARRLIGNARLPKTGRRLPPLLTSALEKVLEQGASEPADVGLLFPLLLERVNFEERGKILRFLDSPAARRALFLEGLSRDPQGQREEAWVWRHVLDGEDAGWLLDLFLAREDRPDWMLEVLYFVAYREGVPQELRRSVRRVLRDTDAGKLAVLDQNRKRWKRKQESTQRETPPEFEIESLVREALDSEEIELRHKMLRLSWYCFEPPSQRPSNLSGRWEDLPAELRLEVLAVCREALAQCAPTPIPASASYSRWTSWEAACFDRLANEDADFVLMPEMIRKWLPALLRAWVSGSGYEPTLRRCFEVDRHLAEDLFAGAVRRAVLAEKSTYVLQNLPPELWSERFSGMLEAIVADMEVAPEMRIDLLVWIGKIFPLRAQPFASVWAQVPEEPLRDAGIDILLMVAPEEGWRHLKALAERENPKGVFRRMRSLLPHHYGPSASFDSWLAAQLAELEELLLQGFPPDADPQWEAGEARSLGGDNDLRSVRDQIPQVLYRRDGEGDHAVLESLADRHRHIREWLDDVRAQQGAESVIAGLGRGTRPPTDSRRVSPADLLKLLQDAEHRLLGSVEDLQEAVLEELRRIQCDARQHLSMLYRPKTSKGKKRERLHEDALQAYVACRLTDRLPRVLGGRGLKVEPAIDREPLAARNTRNDIKIQAPSIDGTRLTVIVEVKWSDNAEVSTNLGTQLGEAYLLQSGYSHGIYFVGWCGPTRRWPDREACQAEMEEQARLFCEAHPSLRIVPLVMDLAWNPEPMPST